MSARLRCISGTYRGQLFSLKRNGITIGQDPSTSDIVVDSSSVLGSQVRVFWEDGSGVFLENLNSQNDIYVWTTSSDWRKLCGKKLMSHGEKFSLNQECDHIFEIILTHSI